MQTRRWRTRLIFKVNLFAYSWPNNDDRIIQESSIVSETTIIVIVLVDNIMILVILVILVIAVDIMILVDILVDIIILDRDPLDEEVIDDETSIPDRHHLENNIIIIIIESIIEDPLTAAVAVAVGRRLTWLSRASLHLALMVSSL